MARVTGDRIKETTATTGTGTITLDGAVAQFRAFSAEAADLDTLHYAIVGQSGVEWEVGLGTWNTGGTLTRVAGDVLSGSAGAGVLTNFSAGAKDVFITIPASTIAGKQTIHVPATAMVARTSAGAAAGAVETTTNKVMLSTLDFDATVDEFAQFSVQMPKSWNAGTVTAQFIWSHPTTTVNFGVRFFIQGLALTDGDAADTAFGTAVGHTADTGGTTDDIYITAETTAITIANTPAKKDFTVFQVFRDVSDAGDTLAVDARLHGISLFYTADAATDA